MKILQINTIDNKGGAAKVAYSLKTEFQKMGHKSSMFVKLKYSKDPDVTEMNWPNPTNAFLKKMTGKDIGSFIHNKIRPWLANDVEWFKTDKILTTPEFKEADIIHCHNLHGNYFKLDTIRKINRIKPVVWTLHDMWAITPYCAHTTAVTPKDGFYACINPPGYPSLFWNNEKHLITVKREAYKNSKLNIVVPCEWLNKKIHSSILGNNPITVIPNGIDTSVFKPQNKMTARQKLGLPQDKKIALFLSTRGQTKEKGWEHVEMTIKQMRNYSNTIFIAIGGKTKNALADNLIETDYINNNSVLAEYYSASDVLLFPSPAETFPLVVLEAMACGLPVVAFDVGGVGEAVIHKETGFLAKPDDNNNFIDGIRYVLNLNDTDFDKLKSNAVSSAITKFSIEIMAKKYLGMYHRIIKEKTNI